MCLCIAFVFILNVSAYAQRSPDVIMQGFYWDTHPGVTNDLVDGGIWWDSLAATASTMAQAGFQMVWTPPPTKGFGGVWDMGYGLYDYYDFGEYDQKGTTRTRHGSRSQMENAIAALQGAGLDVMFDVVLNHRGDADAQQPHECNDGENPDDYTVFTPASGILNSNASHFHPNNQHCDIDPDYHNPIFFQDVCHFNPNNDQTLQDESGTTLPWYFGSHTLGEMGDWQILWGRYLTQTLGVDAFRIDAVKHIEPGFTAPWLVELNDGAQPFAVGEFIGDAGSIKSYRDQVESFVSTYGDGTKDANLAMFDFPLRDALKAMCNDGSGGYDVRGLNGAGLHFAGVSSEDVVTFVENHDKDRIGFVGASCTEAGAICSSDSSTPPGSCPDNCLKLGQADDHSPVVQDKHMAYAYLMAAEGRPTVFWKDYWPNWYGLKPEIDLLMLLRRHMAGGESAQMNLLGPSGGDGSSALTDLWALRRVGDGSTTGMILTLNDNPTTTLETYVDTPFAGQELKDYSDAFLFQSTATAGDGRALVKAGARNYAWYAPTGLYPQPSSEPSSAFTLEADPGGKLHYVVLRAADAANFVIDGTPIQAGDEVAVLGPSGTDVAGIGRIGQSVRWDGTHDMIIEVLGNATSTTGNGRLNPGDPLQLVVRSSATGQQHVIADAQFAPSGQAFTFSADRLASRGGSTPFSVTTSATDAYTVGGISRVTSFEPTAPTITVDGDLSENDYISVATKQNGNTGFGSNIDVSEIIYAVDPAGEKIYLGVESKLNTGSTDGIGLWLNVTGSGAPTGAAAGSNLGINTGGNFHYINDGGGGQANLAYKADFEVDAMLAIRQLNGTNADMFGGDLIGTTGAAFVCQTTLSGASCTGGPFDFDGDGNSGSITFAFNNGGGADQGWEICIDFDVLGAAPEHDIETFAMVVSETAFFSDVTVPGNVTTGNPGFNADFGALSGGPYNTSPVPLPVELTAFDAVLDGTTARLRWTTASETNNAGFEVQQRQEGGADARWQEVGFVGGAGTTEQPQRYEHAITGLAPGRHQFRLKQVDFDGAFEYSPTVEVIVGLTTPHVVEPVYPNPVVATSTFQFAVQQGQHVDVALYDALGRRVRSLYDAQAPAEVLQRVRIDGAGLPSGTYFVRVDGETFAETQQIVIVP
jgi:hypothetical protein